MAFGQICAETTAFCVGSKLCGVNVICSAELLENRVAGSAAHKQETKASVSPEAPHAFTNRMLFVGKAERSRIVHDEGTILERMWRNLVAIGPIFCDNDLFFRNAPRHESSLHVLAQGYDAISSLPRKIS
jgi:hypothetical protein